MRRSRGMTLVEALLSLTLFLIVFGLVANFMQMASQSGQSLEDQDLLGEGYKLLAGRLSSDIRGATVWTRPAPGNAAAVTDLDMELPDLTQDGTNFPYPFPNPGPNPPAWNPLGSQLRVTYQLQGNRLLRSGTPVGVGLKAFQAQRLDRRRIQVTIQVQLRETTRDLTTIVDLPLQRAWGP